MTQKQATTQQTAQLETYEAIYEELAQVVTRLGEGNLSLETMLQLYERGIQLAAECQKMLDDAELKVQQIQESAQQQQALFPA